MIVLIIFLALIAFYGLKFGLEAGCDCAQCRDMDR